MFLETLMFNRANRKQENYVQDEDSAHKNNSVGSILYLMMVMTYMLVLVLIWFRLIYLAFDCSIWDGLASILCPVHYNLYKFGDLISISCKR